MNSSNNLIFAENSEMPSEEIHDIREKVANILQTARVQKGLTQEQLAELSGFSRSTIVRIEQCQFSPNSDQLYILLKILDIEMKLNDQKI